MKSSQTLFIQVRAAVAGSGCHSWLSWELAGSPNPNPKVTFLSNQVLCKLAVGLDMVFRCPLLWSWLVCAWQNINKWDGMWYLFRESVFHIAGPQVEVYWAWPTVDPTQTPHSCRCTLDCPRTQTVSEVQFDWVHYVCLCFCQFHHIPFLSSFGWETLSVWQVRPHPLPVTLRSLHMPNTSLSDW